MTRWVKEVVGLLAARAPRLDRALKKIARKGGDIVLLDGSVIRTRRRTGRENRKNYSGENKCHGLLVIAVTDDRGRLLWISAAAPGAPRRSPPAGTTSSPGNCGKPGSAPSPTWGSSAPTTAAPTVITGYKTARTDPAPPKPLTVRQVTGWLTRRPAALSAEDRASLNDVLARCPELDTPAGHVRDFGEILTGRLGSTLPAWIDAVEASQLPGLTGFALHLRRDLDAVAAGLTLNWSSCSIGAP
ncbi:hypothetical protein ACIRD4_30050 [Streptomyces clavifer]|uniref:hypothetical protein n=1 Tax=Streptomyces clavifer TaxID=68188 RepID=UPI00382AC66C